MNKNFQSANENNEQKSKAKGLWKHVGFFAIALVIAIVTVFVLNLNVNA